MNLQHPFVIIDQNQLRKPEAIAEALKKCAQEGLQILLPDGAFFEFSKGTDLLGTWRSSLSLLAPHHELVHVSRKLSKMWAEELRSGVTTSSLVDLAGTDLARRILFELNEGRETTLRDIIEKQLPELLPPALSAWDNHSRHKEMIGQLQLLLLDTIPAERVSVMRQRPEKAVSEWLASKDGLGFVFQGMKAVGVDDESALALSCSASVYAGFLSAMAGLVVYWLAFGGHASSAPRASTNDLHDIEYIVLAALSKSFASVDRRAVTVYGGVRAGYDFRRSFPTGFLRDKLGVERNHGQ